MTPHEPTSRMQLVALQTKVDRYERAFQLLAQRHPLPRDPASRPGTFPLSRCWMTPAS
ncbi:MAG: hypothetical protein H0T89_04380 [Deltaproteobacteria bacterium]|nr:hypothetical protein [Deltaproteobacteria bacterium]MDQ3295686.1 hypothetical protein [Myxococcota bacterium]